MFTALDHFMIKSTVFTDNKVNTMRTKMMLFHVTLNPLPQNAAERGDPCSFLLFLQLHELHQLVGFPLQGINKLIQLTSWSCDRWVLRSGGGRNTRNSREPPQPSAAGLDYTDYENSPADNKSL